jgi:hypothetical protein
MFGNTLVLDPVCGENHIGAEVTWKKERSGWNVMAERETASTLLSTTQRASRAACSSRSLGTREGVSVWPVLVTSYSDASVHQIKCTIFVSVSITYSICVVSFCGYRICVFYSAVSQIENLTEHKIYGAYTQPVIDLSMNLRLELDLYTSCVDMCVCLCAASKFSYRSAFLWRKKLCR